MKIGIDLGTTNSALAYIDEREAEDRDFPPVHIFETPQLVAAGRVEPRRTLPSFLFLEDGAAGGRLRARTGRAGAHAPGAFGQIVALQSGRGPHRQNPAVGFAGDRPRALAGGSFGAVHRQVPRGVGPREGRAAGRAGHRPHRARLVRRRGPRADRDGGARCRPGAADAARRAGRGVLFVDRQQPGAIAQEAVRRPDRAGVRRGRRHQRFQPDPRFARRRPGQLHAHRRGQAPAAGRRQPGSDAGLAGGNQAGRAAFHPPAQRPAAPMLRGQGEAAQRSGSARAWRSPCWARARRSSAKR